MMSQTARVLKAIKDSGDKGIENYKLAQIALKYSSRIAELRQEGHEIIAVRVYAHGRWTGTWKYHLGKSEQEKRSIFSKIFSK